MNAGSYFVPLWGEAKMSGAVWRVGRRMSMTPLTASGGGCSRRRRAFGRPRLIPRGLDQKIGPVIRAPALANAARAVVIPLSAAGALSSGGERLLDMQEVPGSIPGVPTTPPHPPAGVA